jgi:hypothetical protein
VIWLFRRGLFRPFGPAWLAFAGYHYWRRLPPERKAAIKRRARALTTSIQRALGSTSADWDWSLRRIASYTASQ